MRVRTTITLPDDLLKRLDQRAKSRNSSRSQYIETLLSSDLARSNPDRAQGSDIELINANIAYLNSEVEDVLLDQTPL
jgi:metal-responsive CopG/Arc/MetJ family transcriptional regulator